mgnify:CR=1 FL=1
MSKGIIYAMTTVVDGLVKIGKTGSDNFEQRMTYLENNGYRNICGLKRKFAIEVEDYDKKELLLDSLFSRSRVSNTEIFSLNINEVIQLLSSFEGKIIYPPQENKNVIFENATEAVESLLIPNGTYFLNVNPRGENFEVKATMIVQDGKMTVQKGAILGNIKNLTVANWRVMRESLKTNGNISAEDFEATSPSMAAAIVLGYNSNGWTAWKNSGGDLIDIYRSHINKQSE